MALQIRRGTDAERILITPQPGELIFTTDTKLVYVGDGSTLGGKLIGENPAVAGDLAGDLFLNNFEITGSGNINITGDIINSGSTDITGNLIVTGDILGTGNISRTGDINLFGSAYISGSLAAGTFVGELNGSVFADDSSGLLVDGINQALFGKTITASTVDGIESTIITGSGITYTNQSSPVEYFNLGTQDQRIGVKMLVDKGMQVEAQLKDGLPQYATGGMINFVLYRGTPDVPEDVPQGYPIAQMSCVSYYGGFFKYTGQFGFVLEDQTTAGPDVSPATFVVGSESSYADFENGDLETAEGALRFTSKGILKVPVLKVNSYDAAGITGITAETGMIIFNGDTGKFQGFDGTSWVDLN